MNFDAVKSCLIQEAHKAGLVEYEVYFMESSDMSTETLKQEISSFSSGVSGGVSFRCIVDGKMGCASTELLSEEEMGGLVARAVESARYIENEDKVILYAGDDRYQSVKPPLVTAPDSLSMKKLALGLQERLYAEHDSVIDGTQTGVFVNHMSMELLNSHGLHLTNRVSVSGVYAQAVVKQDGESQEAFDFSMDLSEEALDKLTKETVAEARSKVGAVEIPSGKYDVIFSGKEMRSLLSAYAGIFSAKKAQLGLSLLKGREGEAIASEAVTLLDDPFQDGCPVQTGFDGEGVATYRKAVIEKGSLNTLLYDLATAHKAGVKSTGNGQRVGYAESVSIRPYSFYFEAGDLSEDALMERMGDGLYVTELKGLHAGCNSVTGDFSVESAGYMVRGGKCCEAVKSFTIAGNFFDLMRDVEAFADRIHFGIPSGFTVYGSPDVLVRQMSVAGK